MIISIAAVAFSAVLMTADSADLPEWQTSYSAGKAKAATEGKPLAVFLGKGANGSLNVVRGGDLEATAVRLLNDRYVSVYIDVTTPAGEQLAKSFGAATGSALIISDRTGTKQAFYHEGTIDGSILVKALERYSDTSYVVRTTESIAALDRGVVGVSSSSYGTMDSPSVASPSGTTVLPAMSRSYGTCPNCRR